MCTGWCAWPRRASECQRALHFSRHFSLCGRKWVVTVKDLLEINLRGRRLTGWAGWGTQLRKRFKMRCWKDGCCLWGNKRIDSWEMKPVWGMRFILLHLSVSGPSWWMLPLSECSLAQTWFLTLKEYACSCWPRLFLFLSHWILKFWTLQRKWTKGMLFCLNMSSAG